MHRLLRFLEQLELHAQLDAVRLGLMLITGGNRGVAGSA